MTIEFNCPHCGKFLRTKDEKAGLSTRCPDCKNPITVPTDDGYEDYGDDYGGGYDEYSTPQSGYDPSGYGSGYQSGYGAPPPPAPMPTSYGGAPPMASNAGDGLALTSMILGIIGIPIALLACLCCGFIHIISGSMGLAAVICGFIGLSKAKVTGNSSVRGKALTGVITGFVCLGFILIQIILVIIRMAMGGGPGQQPFPNQFGP